MIGEKYPIILHAGLHKTGTTSFQEWLKNNDDYMFALGVSCYKPLLVAKRYNGSEIGQAVLRPGVRASVLQRDPKKRDALKENIASQLKAARAVGNALLISGEDISFVRTLKEAYALQELLGASPVLVMLVIRDKESWWESLRCQIERRAGKVSQEHDGWTHLAAKGWLLDFDSLIEVMRTVFSHLVVLEYGLELERSGDIVPGLLREIGVPVNDEYRGVFLNENSRNRGMIKRALKFLRRQS